MVRLLSLVMLVLSFCSCVKREYVDQYDKEASPFFINGLKNFNVYRNPFDLTGPLYQWPLLVDYKSDTPKQIQLSVVHENQKLRCWIEGENEAYPDFESQVVLYDSGAANGLYNFTLLVARTGDTVRKFPFQITLAGSQNCSVFLSEFRFLGDVYGPGSENLLHIRTTIPTPGSDTLIFHHLRKGVSLATIPDCYNGRILVPKQQIGDTTYSGGGTVKYDKIFKSKMQIELYVLEEVGIWGATANYRIFSR